MKKGFMIAFDGGNGAGKSSVIRMVGDRLSADGHQVVFSREPGGTVIGEKLREIVLSPDTPEMHDVTEAMIFAASRAQHVRQLIIPAIEAGKVVICDRFAASGVSFQHYGRGISLHLIKSLNAIALGGFKPDLTIILDIDPEVGAQRVKSRGEKLERVELAELDFHTRAREGFLAQARENPDDYRIIDASKSLDQVINDVFNVINEKMSRVIQFIA